MTPAAVQHRMTIEEYLRFVDVVGLDQVELVNGVVYDVSPEGPLHSDVAVELLFVLRERFPHRKVKNVGSVRLDERTLVQPDVYVLDMDRHVMFASNNDYPTADQVVLVVEVAVTTRIYDVGIKLAAYAAAGVPEHWLVDPAPGGSILRHTEPVGGAYRKAVRLDLPDGAASLDAVHTWLD